MRRSRGWSGACSAAWTARRENASVTYGPEGLKRVTAKLGLAVRADTLTTAVNAALVRPDGARTVRAEADLTKPRIGTTAGRGQVPDVHLRGPQHAPAKFYKHLKLAHTYNDRGGHGRASRRPAGLYHIQNKQVNPSWHVPNSAWAGKLAGKVIPPGPDDPIKARWMGIFDGAGIHGTDEIGSLGSRRLARLRPDGDSGCGSALRPGGRRHARSSSRKTAKRLAGLYVERGIRHGDATRPGLVPRQLSAFDAALKARGMAEKTRRAYGVDLEQLGDMGQSAWRRPR